MLAPLDISELLSKIFISKYLKSFDVEVSCCPTWMFNPWASHGTELPLVKQMESFTTAQILHGQWGYVLLLLWSPPLSGWTDTFIMSSNPSWDSGRKCYITTARGEDWCTWCSLCSYLQNPRTFSIHPRPEGQEAALAWRTNKPLWNKARWTPPDSSQNICGGGGQEEGVGMPLQVVMSDHNKCLFEAIGSWGKWENKTESLGESQGL